MHGLIIPAQFAADPPPPFRPFLGPATRQGPFVTSVRSSRACHRVPNAAEASALGPVAIAYGVPLFGVMLGVLLLLR